MEKQPLFERLAASAVGRWTCRSCFFAIQVVMSVSSASWSFVIVANLCCCCRWRTCLFVHLLFVIILSVSCDRGSWSLLLACSLPLLPRLLANIVVWEAHNRHGVLFDCPQHCLWTVISHMQVLWTVEVRQKVKCAQLESSVCFGNQLQAQQASGAALGRLSCRESQP